MDSRCSGLAVSWCVSSCGGCFLRLCEKSRGEKGEGPETRFFSLCCSKYTVSHKAGARPCKQGCDIHTHPLCLATTTTFSHIIGSFWVLLCSTITPVSPTMLGSNEASHLPKALCELPIQASSSQAVDASMPCLPMHDGILQCMHVPESVSRVLYTRSCPVKIRKHTVLWLLYLDTLRARY